MRPRLLALVALVLALVLALGVGPARAQDGSSTSPTPVPVPEQGIVPDPNVGEEPEDPGDRGGALQLAVLGLVVVGICAAVVLVVRQSKRARSGT
jgi:hypothetical protein